MHLRRFLSLGLLPLLGACPIDDDETGDEAGQLDAYSIIGSVSRIEAAVPTGDGVGTLYVAALESCALTAPLVGGTAVLGADVSAPEAAVAFEIPDLPPGDHALVLFLDDDLSADPTMPAPSPGDLVYADVVGDGVVSCVTVTVDDEDVEGVALWLTGVVPGA